MDSRIRLYVLTCTFIRPSVSLKEASEPIEAVFAIEMLQRVPGC